MAGKVHVKRKAGRKATKKKAKDVKKKVLGSGSSVGGGGGAEAAVTGLKGMSGARYLFGWLVGSCWLCFEDSRVCSVAAAAAATEQLILNQAALVVAVAVLRQQ
jgi:hypothetical protein